MLRSVRVSLLAISVGLGACAGELPVAANPLQLHILPSNDTLVLRVYSFDMVSAAVYLHGELWTEPQPEIVWSLSNLSGVVATVDPVVDPSKRRVTGVGVGLARLVASVPSLELADTVFVRVWSPVATLLFELEEDTVFLTGHIGWRLEARDASGAPVDPVLVSVRASLDSLVQVIRNSGIARRLGTGTLTATAPPFSVERQVTVVPLLIDELRQGYAHSCVRRSDSRIMCGGQNAYLQLGRQTPSQCSGFNQQYCVFGSAGNLEVPELGEVSAYDVARNYACAIRVGGELLCWGASSDGQLGTTVDNVSCGNPIAGYPIRTCLLGPRPVESPLRFRMVSTGGSTVCALTSDDKAWCWGSSSAGARLGNGSLESSNTPVAVSGEHSFRTIAAGEHTTCAVDFSDAAWCWGRGAEGELGAGPGVSTAAVPTRVVGDVNFLTVRNGIRGTCGLSTAGQAFCWGGTHTYRGGTALPEGCVDEATPSSCFSTPLAVAGDLRFTEIAVGGDACGATAAGEVWCWNTDAPERVIGVPPLTRITVSEYWGCGISAAQASHCWRNGTREPLAIVSR